MDTEIKRLLKLSNIPGFKLSNKEQQILEDWKKAQKDVKPPKKVKKVAPKGFHYDEEIGTSAGPALIRTNTAPEGTLDEKTVNEPAEEIKAVKNVVKAEEKEIGKIEEA